MVGNSSISLSQFHLDEFLNSLEIRFRIGEGPQQVCPILKLQLQTTRTHK